MGIQLANPTSTLAVVTSGAQSTDVHASYLTLVGLVVKPGALNTHVAAAVPAPGTTIVAGPAAGVRRVKYVNIRNHDAATANTITVLHFDGTTTVKLFSVTLPAGYEIEYNEDTGWIALDNAGNRLVTVNAGGAGTVATVASGETYALLSTDIIIRFDTTGGTTATANMAAGRFVGQRILFYWWAWGAGQVAPTINAPAGQNLVPFSGQAASGAAGLAATTSISTPGASYALEWDGTEWVAA